MKRHILPTTHAAGGTKLSFNTAVLVLSLKNNHFRKQFFHSAYDCLMRPHTSLQPLITANRLDSPVTPELDTNSRLHMNAVRVLCKSNCYVLLRESLKEFPLQRSVGRDFSVDKRESKTPNQVLPSHSVTGKRSKYIHNCNYNSSV